MTTLTYGQALARHSIDIPEHLAADADVPFLFGMQRQGDLLIIPLAGTDAALKPLTGSVQVVTGEATGNTHWLDGDPGVAWARVGDSVVVQVPDAAVATLTHTDEHGCNGMAPGMYEIRRQREQADEIRVVAD